MAENYINIYAVFITEALRDKKISIDDAVKLGKAFLPVCETIHSRQELIAFLDTHIPLYWELKELKQQLLDPQHHFKEPHE